jgi:hypothetical protein
VTGSLLLLILGAASVWALLAVVGGVLLGAVARSAKRSWRR